MGQVRVKICGLTRAADVSAAVAAGADALGFVFALASPRCLQVATAVDLVVQVPAFVSRVGLFLNQQGYTQFRRQKIPELIAQHSLKKAGLETICTA